MSDATSVLFGLEHEFSVVEVRRVDAAAVKVIMEQAGAGGPVSSVWGGQQRGEGSAGDAAEGSADLWADRGAVVAETPSDL
jgi:hypothetical protein